MLYNKVNIVHGLLFFMANSIHLPRFSMTFFYPRYWLIWLGLSVLFLVSLLPLPILRKLAHGNAWLLKKLAKKRISIAEQNIALCFPDMPALDQAALLKKHYVTTGMALFETAIGWWWPDWRLRRIIEIEGFEHIETIQAQGKGVLALGIHNVNIETGCRMLGLFHKSIAFYRPHNNPLMDYIQFKGRARSNEYLIDKRSSKALIEALDAGKLCAYLPDQDYGPRGAVFVPFFGVEKAATISATLMFARRSNCIPLMLSTQTTQRGYKVKFYPPMEDFAAQEDVAALTDLNQRIESMILEQPESYLWMHKRFKTRPPGEPSLYQ